MGQETEVSTFKHVSGGQMKVRLLQALVSYTNQADLVSTTVLMTTWQTWHQLILPIQFYL